MKKVTASVHMLPGGSVNLFQGQLQTRPELSVFRSIWWEIINRVMRSPDGLFRNWGGAYSSGEIADQVHMPVKRVEEVLNMVQSRCLFETPVERKKIVIWWILYRMKKCHFFRTRHPLYFLHEQLVEVLQTLTPREQQVLSLRFGLYDGEARTLEEVGKKFHVTRERIRRSRIKLFANCAIQAGAGN